MKRWIPTLTMTLMSLLSYVDRNTLALLAPTILAETGLTNEQYGWIISAFSVCYTLANPVWGRWLDKFGLRIGLLASVAFWTVASVGHAFAKGFWSFAAARAALGFGEGATFPGALRTVVQTLPLEVRARGIAVAYGGGSLGAILTPVIVTPVAAAWGWRGAFWFTGIIGAVWLMLWLMVSRNEAIGKQPASVHHGQRQEPPSFRDKRLWSFIFAYAFGALPLGFILYSAALYLKALGKSQVEIGRVLWIPPLGWEIGYFFWGWLSDRWLRAFGHNVRTYRALFTAMVLLSLPLALTSGIRSFPLLMIQMFFAMFMSASFIIVGVSYGIHMFTQANSAFVAGLGAGSWSALVALVMPLIGWLFDRRMYTEAFVVSTAFPVLGYAVWTWMNSEELRAAAAGRRRV
jgi:ACS family hexuronate transporter-like MFS transporter